LTGFREQVEEIAQEAHTLTPAPDTWGFYAYSDGPVEAGGGTGGFLWFASRHQLLDFIARYLPFWCAGPARGDDRAVAAKLRDIVSSLDGNDITNGARERFNQVLQGHAHITWCGQFGELLSSDSAFATEIRAWYWGNRGRKNVTAPISKDQASTFSECLQDYGI
jgi:hypothetical protein